MSTTLPKLLVLALLAGILGCGGAPQVTSQVDAAAEATAPVDANVMPDAPAPPPCSDPTVCNGKCGLLVNSCGVIVDCGGCNLGTICGGARGLTGTVPNVCGSLPCTAYCGPTSCGKSDGCASVCFGVTGKCPVGQVCSTTTNACECDPLACTGCCGSDGTCDTSCQCGGKGTPCCTGASASACQAPLTCGGGGLASACGCTPSCGTAMCGQGDGCGGFCPMGSCPTGQACDLGICVCNATSCPTGCCSGDQCEPGTTSAACGGPAGEACSTCVGGASCSDRLCVAGGDSDGGGEGGTQDTGPVPDGSGAMDSGVPDGSGDADATVMDSSDQDSTAPSDSGLAETGLPDSGAPMDTGTLEPMDTGTVGPMDTGTVAPTDTGTVGPTDTGTVAPVDTGSPSEDDASGDTGPIGVIEAGGACFPAGMPVVMADGTSRRIEDIRVGELIQSYDPSTNRLVPGRVRARLSHRPELAPELVLIDESLLSTDEHPFYVDGRHVRADALTVGTRLTHMSERSALEGHLVRTVRRVPGKVTTFELVVDGSGIYLVDSVMVFGKGAE